MSDKRDIIDTVQSSMKNFETKHGAQPVGISYVLHDGEGNALSGHVIPIDLGVRSTLALAGAMLTAEAVDSKTDAG